MGTVVYRRVLLKLSGEALMGSKSFGLEPDVVRRFQDPLRHRREALRAGVEQVVGAAVVRVAGHAPMVHAGVSSAMPDRAAPLWCRARGADRLLLISGAVAQLSERFSPNHGRYGTIET